MAQIIHTSDGVDLTIEVKGQGLPCLYLHGGPGSGSYWAEKFSAGTLEQYFQMIYLDQRGVARSTSPRDGNYSLERMVQDFEEVRAALGIGQWLTMGHSFGGIFQVGYAQRRPQTILGMVMLNCALNLMESSRGSWIRKACEFLEIADPAPYLDEATPLPQRMQTLINLLRERDLFWKMSYASKESSEQLNATFGEIPNWNGDQEDAILGYPEYFDDYSAATAELVMPVLFFYGLTDWMVGPGHYRCARFPNMLLWPSEVGHVAILENKPDLENAIAAFVDRYGFRR